MKKANPSRVNSRSGYTVCKAQYGYQTDWITGLILCTNRWYDPINARWLTRDPIGYDGGIGLYGFADGNPVMGADPSGLQSEDVYEDNIFDIYGELGREIQEEDEAKEREAHVKQEELYKKPTHLAPPQPDFIEKEEQEALDKMLGRRSGPYPNPDPPMSELPHRYEPESTEEVERMRRGRGPRTRAGQGVKNIEAHHRQ